MRKTDIMFSVVYIIVMAIAATQLLDLEDMSSAVVSAKLYPWLVIGIGGFVGLLELLRSIFARPDPDAPSFAEIWHSALAPRRMRLLALFIIYLLAIKPIGFLIATAIFCTVTILVLSPKRDVTGAAIAVSVSVGTVGLIYLLLVVYLQAFLP